MKKIAILGSTGSIGTQTLDVVRANGDIEVLGISAGRNVKMLEEQAREFHPQLIAVWDENAAKDLAVRLADMDVKIVSGMEGLLELARMPQTDILVTAVVGMIGIRPTMEGIKAGKDIALANKETLVTSGGIFMDAVAEKGVRLLPVDSEHSAIFQSLHGGNRAELEKILLTASGGPFFGKTRAELSGVTKEDALRHPNWSMGAKITVDSATLMNKGLEIIEAKWLFGVDIDDIEVVVQRESIIHSMVEFVDGSIIAQLSLPSMKHPIQYAFTYPYRLPSPDKRLSFCELGKMTFFEPDEKTFRCLALAKKAGRDGGIMPTVLNAANEIAVDAFLHDRIGFLDIADFVEKILSDYRNIPNPTVEDIINTDREIRAKYTL